VSLHVENEISCYGGNNGVVEASISGGKKPFQFNWTNRYSDTKSLENLPAGEFEVTVNDATGQSTSSKILLTQPEQLIVQVTIQSPASTDMENGKALAKADGGSGEYIFSWDNSEQSAMASALAPGIHTVTVTDASGCTEIGTVEIKEDILPISISIIQTSEISCNGASDAAIEVSVEGGKGPFQYQWDSPAITGQEQGNLLAGTYKLTVTDISGQSSTSEITINQPEKLIASIEVQGAATTGENDGKALASVTGGKDIQSFLWDNGETGQIASNLTPGSHSVTITDAGACTVTASVDVPENVLPLTIKLNQVNQINCFGSSEGSISADISGGKMPYQYQWGNSDIDGPVLEGLVAGAYEVTVSDAAGQMATSTISLSQPSSITVIISEKKPTTTEKTLDGRAGLNVSGGTAPYIFKWDHGESGAVAENLGFGTHAVTIEDANGCSTIFTFEVEKRILPELTAGVLRNGQTIKIQKLNFEADSSNITDSSLPVLNELYQFLDENPFIVIEIGGHTNGLPEHDFCDKLSSARAKSVAQYLVDKGLNPKRVVYKGYGKRKPIATNQTSEGRKKNQRVEVKILRLSESDE
jgi:outer membrane protein OmpA-like peptidoglycan-associated protein